MNKKILIASIFATLILLVPMTSVVGVISKNVTMDNQPPNPPTITGRTRGKVGVAYAFTFNAVDPDGDNVSYYVDWGDGASDGWTDYIESGFDIRISHTWTKKGKYLIRCKANDTHGAESDWAEFYGFNVRENKTVTHVTVDNQPSVEDCGCQTISNHNLNGLEKFEEISNRITILKTTNEKLNDDPLLCIPLAIIIASILLISLRITQIAYNFYLRGMYSISEWLYKLADDVAYSCTPFLNVYIELGCGPHDIK